MRIAVLLAVASMAMFCAPSAAEEPAETGDEKQLAERAKIVLEGDDDAYASLRSALEGTSVAECLALLDAVRRESPPSLYIAVPDGLGLPSAPAADDDARREGPILERALAEASPWCARVEAHFLRVHEDAAQALLGAHLPRVKPAEPNDPSDPDDLVPPPPVSGSIHAVSAELAATLLRGRSKGPVRQEELPLLDLFDGQAGTLLSQGRVRYLMDYGHEGSDPPRPVPLVGTTPDGTEVVVLARRTEGSEQITLEVDARWAALLRPVPSWRVPSVTTAEGRQATIQLPEILIWGARGTVAVPVEGWVLACSQRDFFTREYRLVLLHVSRAPPPAPVELEAVEHGAPACGADGRACR